MDLLTNKILEPLLLVLAEAEANLENAQNRLNVLSNKPNKHLSTLELARLRYEHQLVMCQIRVY